MRRIKITSEHQVFRAKGDKVEGQGKEQDKGKNMERYP